MRLFHGACEIDGGEQHEHDSLNETHEDSQEQNREWGKIQTGEAEKDTQDFFFPENVPEKPNTQGHDSGQMTDHFNHEHEGRQGPDRPEKMPDVFDSVKLDPDGVGEDERA